MTEYTPYTEAEAAALDRLIGNLHQGERNRWRRSWRLHVLRSVRLGCWPPLRSVRNPVAGLFAEVFRRRGRMDLRGYRLRGPLRRVSIQQVGGVTVTVGGR